MELGDYLREPAYAAIFAALVVAVYIHIRSKMNNEGELTTAEYAKPAVLTGILVWFIVAYGIGGKEVISNEPF